MWDGCETMKLLEQTMKKRHLSQEETKSRTKYVGLGMVTIKTSSYPTGTDEMMQK